MSLIIRVEDFGSKFGRMIYFLRSADIAINSRLQRYQNALDERNVPYKAIYWDRNIAPRAPGSDREIPYTNAAAFGRRFALASKFLAFNRFVFAELWRRRREVNVVHAVDFDTAMPAMLFSILGRKPLVYDLYDSFVDSRMITGPLRWTINLLEKFVIARASLVIIADPIRTAQHPHIADKKLLVIENVPMEKTEYKRTSPGSKEKLKLGYLGTLEPYHRGLEDVLSVLGKLPFVEFHVGGAGSLEPMVRQSQEQGANLVFHGAMDHRDGMQLMANCDIMLGLYYDSVPNHRWAAPNKYFEHLMLGIPLLTSIHTPPGAKVSSNETGWAVPDGAAPIGEALIAAFENPVERKKRGTNARNIWEKLYANYHDEAIGTNYVERVRGLTASK